MNESKGKIVATKDTVNGLNAKLEPVEVIKVDFVYITFTYCTMIIHRLPLQVWLLPKSMCLLCCR